MWRFSKECHEYVEHPERHFNTSNVTVQQKRGVSVPGMHGNFNTSNVTVQLSWTTGSTSSRPNFNTSNVTVQQIKDYASVLYKTFQYIKCDGSAVLLRESSGSGGNFNTSNVTVQRAALSVLLRNKLFISIHQMWRFSGDTYDGKMCVGDHFNTSNVTVQPWWSV